MRISASALLKQFDGIKDDFSPGMAARKLELMRELDRRSLGKSKEVYTLHEILSFLHAYPDNRRVRATVERMLERFSRRADLKRHADALADSGIEGTPIHYSFYWTTALWLEEKWPGCLTIDWDNFDKQYDLPYLFYMLLPFSESLAIDEATLEPEEWLELLKRREETDAGFFIRRVAKLRANDTIRETIYEELDVPYVLSPGKNTPTRTAARYKPLPVVYQTRPLDRSRPNLKKECLAEPRSVSIVPPRQGQKLIDLTRVAMVTRSRDLHAFQFADKNDVRLIEYEDGLQFAALGLVPEQRLMLDSVYGFLTIKNGVPMGYVLSSSYFNSTEVAYNVFDTFRGAEAARVYGRVLAMMRYLFGADVYTIDPYQMGHDNEEGLKSGAWWFYYKLGFRPLDAGVKRLLRKELAKMGRNPKHRSSLTTLNELSSKNMYLFVGPRRQDVRGIIKLDNIGLAVSRYVGKRFGADREKAVRVCAREAAALTGVGSFEGFTPGERLAWERWSPLMLALPDVKRWNRDELTALAAVARAKGGRHESDFVTLFDAHKRLRGALLEMARRKPPLE